MIIITINRFTSIIIITISNIGYLFLLSASWPLIKAIICDGHRHHHYFISIIKITSIVCIIIIIITITIIIFTIIKKSLL